MTTRRKAKHVLSQADRRAKVAHMLIEERLTVRDAAEAIGCSPGTVSSDYRALLADWQAGAADRVAIETERQLSRLNEMEADLWDDFSGKSIAPMPRHHAGNLLLKVLERRARLLGLDSVKDVNLSPGAVEITVHYQKPEAAQ